MVSTRSQLQQHEAEAEPPKEAGPVQHEHPAKKTKESPKKAPKEKKKPAKKKPLETISEEDATSPRSLRKRGRPRKDSEYKDNIEMEEENDDDLVIVGEKKKTRKRAGTTASNKPVGSGAAGSILCDFFATVKRYDYLCFFDCTGGVANFIWFFIAFCLGAFVLPVVVNLFSPEQQQQPGWKIYTDTASSADATDGVVFSQEYLTEFKYVYGKYGISKPDVIPAGVNIEKLKKNLVRNTPMLKHYGSLERYWTNWSPELENEWDAKFTESYDDTAWDKSKETLEAMYQSAELEGKKPYEGPLKAYTAAASHLADQDTSINVDALRKVHAALHSVDFVNKDELEKPNTPGNFRGMPSSKKHMAPHVFEVQSDLKKLSDYFNDNCAPLPEKSLRFASCALHWYVHYMYVQPFADGNGETGRAWFAAMLSRKWLPSMDLEGYAEDPKKYAALFDAKFEGGKMVVKEEFWYTHLKGILANA